MSDNNAITATPQSVSIEGTLGVGSYILNDYLITIDADEDGNGYWMTIRKGSQEQQIHLTELKQEYVDDAIRTALAEAKASGEFDGYTPTANVVKSGSTATITISDAFGTTTEDIEDGISPVASLRRVDGALEVEIVDAAGTKTGLIYDGPKGDTGDTGVGISNAVLNSDFTLTLTFTDGTTWTSRSLRGPQGLQGVQGVQGPRGFQGLKGDTGPQGPKGDTGETGPQGSQGPKGDTGEVSEEELEAVIAPGFDASTAYTAGSYVLKNGVLYRFTADHTGAWTGTDVVVVTVVGELTRLDNSSGSGLTEGVKVALLACFEKVAWIDEDGQDYYDALYNALYPSTDLVSISAVFTQGSAVIYDTDSLDTLKQYLVVTAHYSDSSTGIITTYTLSGTLAVGTSTITVAYGNKTTTFTVNVTMSRTTRFGTFVNGHSVGKELQTSGVLPRYGVYINTAPARAAIHAPIVNQGYTFTVTDSTKYNINIVGIVDNTPHATDYTYAVLHEYYEGDTLTPSWSSSGSSASPYVIIALKKMGNTSFTTEELANGAEAVFTFTEAST